MSEIRTLILFSLWLVLPFSATARTGAAFSGDAQTAAAGPARHVGTIKAINGATISLTAEAGVEITVTVEDATRIRRIPPGDSNPKDATPLDFKDLQVGDLVRVVGVAADDGKSIAASSIIALKATDIAAQHRQELQDWQKRGSGGVVSAVDPATATVTITVSSLAGKKTIAVHTSKDTVIRRYAPESVKFEDAKVSTLQEIHPGDQLRARGDRNADGTEIAAEEIVTGVFRNIAGTVNSVDASSGIINVQDLQSKKPVQVRVTSDSQLHKLPPEMAQRFAMRLKGATGIPGIPGAGGSGGSSAGNPGGSPVGSSGPGSAAGTATANSAGGPPPASGGQSSQASSLGGRFSGSGVPGLRQGPGGAQPGSGPSSGGGAPGVGRGGDFQQMLTTTPAVALGDLKKGDAIVLLTTEGSSSSPSTVITLVAGVEPILQAAPSASQAMMLAPWSLGGAPGGGEGP